MVEEKIKLVGAILMRIGIILMIIGICGYLITETIDESTLRGYTIQDVHHWCCNNINESITPDGDNCSTVIYEIYNGCYN